MERGLTMKEILDILKTAPITKLVEIDHRLPALILDEMNAPKGTRRYATGERDILYYHSYLAYGQRRTLGWSHERMVNEGEAEWCNDNE